MPGVAELGAHGRVACQRFARNCATRNLATPHDSTVGSTSTCSVAWVGEVAHGGVNSPSINGKDGVAGSIPAGGSTHALTSANADSRRPDPLQPTPSVVEWGCEGQHAVRSLIALLSRNFGRGVPGMA
jgi:hypothetical protein